MGLFGLHLPKKPGNVFANASTGPTLNQGGLGGIQGLTVEKPALPQQNGNPPGFPHEILTGTVTNGVQQMILPQLLNGSRPTPQLPILPRTALDYLQNATTAYKHNLYVQSLPQSAEGAVPPRMVNVAWSSKQVPYSQSLIPPKGWH